VLLTLNRRFIRSRRPQGTDAYVLFRPCVDMSTLLLISLFLFPKDLSQRLGDGQTALRDLSINPEMHLQRVNDVTVHSMKG
jgi:hypothetical protein